MRNFLTASIKVDKGQTDDRWTHDRRRGAIY